MKRKISLTALAIFLVCLLVFLPVVSASVYFTRTVSRQLEHNASETVAVYLDQFTEQTDRMLGTLRDCIYYLTTDAAARRMMQQESRVTQIEILQLEQQFSRAFTLGDSLNPDVVSAIYLLKSTQDYFAVYGGNYYRNTSRRILTMYQGYQDCNAARTLYTDPRNKGYAYMILDFVDLNSIAPLGKIIVELDMRSLLDISSLQTLYPSTAVLFRGTDGREIGSYGADALPAFPGLNAASEITLDGASWYHASRQLPEDRERIDLYIPRSEILTGIRQSTQIYILVTAVILLFALLVAATFIVLLLHPLRQMLHRIGRLASGDLSVRMDETPYRETETLAHAFNDMANRLDTLFYEVYQKGLLLRDAEIGQLESQIQPHFIFNILELINMRCMAAGQPAICTTVQNLAQLLRANVVHHGEQTITFREELEYVKYYLALQKERFEEKLQYAVNLEDPEILDYALPKLTIQPLVENSIVHGLEPKRQGGWVRISIWEEEDAVYIRVSDDGVGFDPSALPAAQPDDRRHAHVALRNIERRIHLLYGEPYGMDVKSAPGEGTSIVLTLPILPGAPEKEEPPCCVS